MDSLQKNTRILKAYKIAAAVISGLLVIASVIAFTLGFEADIRYFNDSYLSLPLAIAALAALSLAVSSLFLFKGTSIDRYPEPLMKFVSMLPMIALIRLAIHAVWSELLRLSQAKIDGIDTAIDLWAVLLLITAIIASIYNLAEIFSRSKALKLVTGLAQILFCIVTIAKLYVDLSVEINSPIKLIVQFAAASVILCTLSDLRQELEIPNAFIFVSSRITSISLGIVTAVAFFAEILQHADKYGEDYSIYPLVFIAYGIKSAVELFPSSFVKSGTSEVCEIIEEMPDEPSDASSDESGDEAPVEEAHEVSEANEAADAEASADENR